MDSEGLFTQIWGPVMWESLHNITFNYPYNPTLEDKVKYYNFFMSVGDVLPCSECRNNYKKHIQDNDTKLSMDVLSSRNTLTRWLFDLHIKVSNKLGFCDGITYEKFLKKHNSYISKGNFTDEDRQKAFINYYDVCSPVMKEEILLCFNEYAKKRGFNNFKINVKKYSNMDRDSIDWYNRNQMCQDQLKYMRINGIQSLEKEGKFIGLPTIDELKLMEMGSSNISKRKIKKILDEKLNCSFITVPKNIKNINNSNNINIVGNVNRNIDF